MNTVKEVPAKRHRDPDIQDPYKVVYIDYTNHQGKRSWRRIVPQQFNAPFYWGWNENHREFQWLLDAWDFDKAGDRTFAMKNIHEWTLDNTKYQEQVNK